MSKMIELTSKTGKTIDDYINRIFYLISPSLLILMHLGYISFTACISFILLRLVSTNKETAGVYFVTFGGLIGGVTRHVFPGIPIYGLILIFFGLLLLSKDIIVIIKRGIKPIIFLFFVTLIFFFFYLYGPKHQYSSDKLIGIIINGFMFFFIYSIINISKRFSNIAIAQLLLLTTISFFVASIQSYGYKNPTSFFDYSWYRLTTIEYSFDYNLVTVGYQEIGMYSLYAFAFFISSINLSYNTNKIYNFLFYITCTQLILLSGARQAIFGLGMLIFIRIAFFSQVHKQSKRIIYILLGFILLFVFIRFINSLNIDFINTVLDRKGDINSITGRGDNLIRAITIIKQNPYFGVGLGGYSPNNMSIYPHNVFLEILSECGLFGFTALIIVLITFYKSNHISFKNVTNSVIVIVKKTSCTVYFE
jgi:O-antigen ligase